MIETPRRTEEHHRPKPEAMCVPSLAPFCPHPHQPRSYQFEGVRGSPTLVLSSRLAPNLQLRLQTDRAGAVGEPMDDDDAPQNCKRYLYVSHKRIEGGGERIAAQL